MLETIFKKLNKILVMLMYKKFQCNLCFCNKRFGKLDLHIYSRNTDVYVSELNKSGSYIV